MSCLSTTKKERSRREMQAMVRATRILLSLISQALSLLLSFLMTPLFSAQVIHWVTIAYLLLVHRVAELALHRPFLLDPLLQARHVDVLHRTYAVARCTHLGVCVSAVNIGYPKSMQMRHLYSWFWLRSPTTQHTQYLLPQMYSCPDVFPGSQYLYLPPLFFEPSFLMLSF